MLPAGGGLSAQDNSVSLQFKLNPTPFPPSPPVFVNTETWFLFSDTFQFGLPITQYERYTCMVIVEFLDIFLFLHLKGKTLQSRMVDRVYPHVFKIGCGKPHTSYTCNCFTNPSQKVSFWHLWQKRVGLAGGELLEFVDTEGREHSKWDLLF